MAKAKSSEVAFGEIQGVTANGIEAYSNGSDMFFSGVRNFDGEVFTGFKWQCVEFARRWLLEQKGLYLPDVPWACMIFLQTEMLRVDTAEKVKVVPVVNGGTTKPVANSLLIWESSEENYVGHVAALVEVGDDYVRVADQNQYFHKWTGHYSREYKMEVKDGKYNIVDDHGTRPLGWVTFPESPDRDRSKPLTFAKDFHRQQPENLALERITIVPQNPKENWLDLNNPAEKKFVDTFGMDVSRSRLDEAEANYYKCNWELMLECVKAGQELHQIFLKATEKVLADDKELELFGIDKEYWPQIRKSFETEKDCITGRFDFAFDPDGNKLKCFEYNADSASTLLECGVIQQKYAESIGIDEGSRSSGFRIGSLLTHAWRETGVKGRVHFLIDTDEEEEYTALYVAQGAAAAGCETKVCILFDEFSWKDGKIVDKDGVEVRTIWKTWMWESAITDHKKAKEERGPNWKPTDSDKVRLSDLMLGDNGIRVFEPMWKLIPSNKAILPMIYNMNPDHPNILRASWEVTDELKKTGYARKPIVGRVGRNISISDHSGEVLHESEGNFGDRDMVYQELFHLPKRNDYYAILGGWILGNGYYAGTGIREDKTIITGVDSPYSALRIMLPKESMVPVRVTHQSVAEAAAAAAASMS